MKKLGWAGVVVAVLLLGGCSAAVGEITTTTIPSAEQPSSEPAPALTAEPVEATPAEEQFDTAIRRIPGLENVDQAEALAVGEQVCAQLDAGTDPSTITAVESTERVNNWDAISVSALTLCTEHVENVQSTFGAIIESEVAAAN